MQSNFLRFLKGKQSNVFFNLLKGWFDSTRTVLSCIDASQNNNQPFLDIANINTPVHCSHRPLRPSLRCTSNRRRLTSPAPSGRIAANHGAARAGQWDAGRRVMCGYWLPAHIGRSAGRRPRVAPDWPPTCQSRGRSRRRPSVVSPSVSRQPPPVVQP